MTVEARQLGVVKETTWGTPVTVSRFPDGVTSVVGEPVVGKPQAFGIKPGALSPSSVDFQPVLKGGEGSFSFAPGISGFGIFLEWAMGSYTVGAGPTRYAHVFKRASTLGKSFTVQIGRNYVTQGSDATLTFAGAKCDSMVLSCDVDGLLTSDFTWASKAPVTNVSRATASYAATQEFFSWHTCTLTVGGASVNAQGFTLNVNNNLRADRYRLNSAGIMEEPLQIPPLNDTITLRGVTFDSLTHYNRVAAALAASAKAAIVIGLAGTTDATSLFSISISDAIALSAPVSMSADDWELTQDLEFACMSPTSGTDTQVKITYTTPDATA